MIRVARQLVTILLHDTRLVPGAEMAQQADGLARGRRRVVLVVYSRASVTSLLGQCGDSSPEVSTAESPSFLFQGYNLKVPGMIPL